MFRKILSLLFKGLIMLISLSSSPLLAQTENDYELAQTYYQEKNFDLARQVLEKTIKDSNDANSSILYLKTLEKLFDKKELARHLKKLNRVPEVLDYSVVLQMHQSYNYLNQKEDADELINQTINRAFPDSRETIKFWKVLKDNGLYEEAIRLLTKASLTNTQSYAEELLETYDLSRQPFVLIDFAIYAIGSDKLSIEPFLDYLAKPLYTADSIDQYITDQSLIALQNQPGNVSIITLLFYHHLNNNRFAPALSQAIALDKREQGSATYTIQAIKRAIEQQEFRIAQMMVKRAQRTFKRPDLYYTFRKLELDIQELQVRNLNNQDSALVRELIDSYQLLLADALTAEEKATLIKTIANLQMNFLNAPIEALNQLKSFLETVSLNSSQENSLRLDMAMAYLLADQPWEASLIYLDISRIEGDSDLSHQAKLNNAKVHFYQGNFKLAKDQLDILKQATSRKISNDAIDLSFVIQENLLADDNSGALLEYARIALLEEQKRYSEAIRAYSTLRDSIGQHILQDDILYNMGKISAKLSDFNQSVQFYNELIKKYPNSIQADNAYLALAKYYIEQPDGRDEADRLLLELIKNYPASSLQVEARKLLRTLKTS